MTPRVRFAPSPTGPLHIGGVRTALYNYLFAKKLGGQFILRIEDTDSQRFVPGAEEYIVNTFKWLGIPFDEGVHLGGEYGPYRQSERRSIYRKYVDELLAKDLAYVAFDTPEELEAMRARGEADKSLSAQYDSRTRMLMRNSLTMPKEEVKTRIDSGEKYVVRIKIEPHQEVCVHDIIRGKVVVDSALLDDKVLWKSSDGLPTYHMANIVDDYKMKITHVIRGEEWLPSAPLHVTLYRYLGWEEQMPQFAHLPLLLKPEGNGKLSKRDGDRLGFPVFPLSWTDPNSGEISSGYREAGYFPQAVINILALLGWNAGTEQELFSLDELVQAFSLERVAKHGAKFDLAKAHWFNHQYLLQQSNEEITDQFARILSSKPITQDVFERKTLEHIIELVKERVNFVEEIWEQADFFFVAPLSYDETMVKKRWSSEVAAILEKLATVLEQEENFDSASLQKSLDNFVEKGEYAMGKVMNGLRLCLVGKPSGPHLNEILSLIGREEGVQRIRKAIATLGK